MSKTYFNISDKLRLYEFDGMLDQYGDAAAAYSLRKLRNGYTGDAIRVRRSSDNTERDMGFYDNELDTVALLNWVNEEYTFIEEPFDGAYTWNVALGSASVNGGVLDFPDGVNTVVFTSIGNTLKTQQVRVTFTILNYQSGSIKFQNYNNGADGTNRTADGTYTEILTISESGNNNFGFGGTLHGQIDDFKIEQLTADGHVHTWYDQSANANHAVQGTDSAQPKIVDAGAVVTEGGKPAITMDGIDDFFLLTSGITSTDYSVLSLLNLDDTFQTSSYGGVITEYLGQTRGFIYHFGQGYNWRDGGIYHKLVHPISETGQHLLFMTVNSTTGNGYINGQLSKTNVSIVNNNITFAALFGTAFGSYIKANVQELVLYTAYRQGEQDDFMFNANAYYNIY